MWFRAALEKKTGLPQERFKTWSIALPKAVYESMCEAKKKLARSPWFRHRGQAGESHSGLGSLNTMDPADR